MSIIGMYIIYFDYEGLYQSYWNACDYNRRSNHDFLMYLSPIASSQSHQHMSWLHQPSERALEIRKSWAIQGNVDDNQ